MSYPIHTPQAQATIHTPQAQAMPESVGFSVTDGLNVVIRGMATGTECLLFAGRKVTCCLATGAGWLFGGIKGTLRYAHENLGNRSVQPPHAAASATQPEANPPWEAYIISDATASADLLSHYVHTAHSQYPWCSGENLGSIAFTFLIPYCLVGSIGSILFNLPRVCGKEPYITFEASPDAPGTQPGVATAGAATPCREYPPGQYSNQHNYYQPPYVRDHFNGTHWRS